MKGEVSRGIYRAKKKEKKLTPRPRSSCLIVRKKMNKLKFLSDPSPNL